MHYFGQLSKTRIILSLWYSFILGVILVGFSIIFSITYNNDVTRIVLRQDFGNHIPAKLSRNEEFLIIAQVRELRSSSFINLLVIDSLTLVIGAGLSYFLAGKTLSPIQKNMESQKLFIADASHELKNPVSTIQSACEVVLRKTTKTKEDYKAVIEQVLDQSQRLGKLVNDLLALSVLDASSTTESFKKISLTKIVEKEVTALQPLFVKSRITLTANDAHQAAVFGDVDKLQQLIGILLDNAQKFTPKGGTVTVSVVTKPQPQLRVTDTGIGIAPEKQEAIFQRFYQAEESRSGKGTGLGLAIAEGLMKLHKGTITVESTLGKGTTFICTFPNA